MKEQTLEGWTAHLGPDLTIEQVIDRAFDYRGNVTVVMKDGSQVIGYLFNRNNQVAQPFVQLFDEEGTSLMTLQYTDIGNILFTGKDMAAGKSYEAYQRRRARASPQPLSSPSATLRAGSAGEGGTRLASLASPETEAGTEP